MSPLAPFPLARPRGHALRSAGSALILVAGLFLLLPLSRHQEAPVEDTAETRPVLRPVVIDPPPPEEAKPEPTDNRTPERPTPRMEIPPPRIQTAGLPLDDRIKIDKKLLRSVPLGRLSSGVDTAEEIRRFTFADLPKPPRVLNVPPVQVPLSLSRRGFTRGVVVFSIRVDRDGSVEVLDVVRTSHQELVEPARRSAARARFEPQKIDGRRVVVYGDWPMVIETF